MPSDIVTSFPPYFCRGEVVKGFGRGSKELGIPTGELRLRLYKSLPFTTSNHTVNNLFSCILKSGNF